MKKERGVSLVSVILILILLAILVVLVWLGIMMMNKDDGEKNIAKANNDESNVQNTNYEDNNEGENTEKELDINGEFVQTLYSKILKSNTIANAMTNQSGNIKNMSTLGFELSFYKDKKVTVDSLSNEEKIITVLQYLHENGKGKKIYWEDFDKNILNNLTEYYEVLLSDKPEIAKYCTVYDESTLETAKKEVFGKDVQINWETVFGFGNTIEFGNTMEYLDGAYYEYWEPVSGPNDSAIVISKIEKAIKYDDYIYIYDKCICGKPTYGDDAPFDEYYTLYTNASLSNKLGEEEILLMNDIHVLDYEWLTKYKNQLDTYKHTFKKDSSGNYYWVSTEKV